MDTKQQKIKHKSLKRSYKELKPCQGSRSPLWNSSLKRSYKELKLFNHLPSPPCCYV